MSLGEPYTFLGDWGIYSLLPILRYGEIYLLLYEDLSSFIKLTILNVTTKITYPSKSYKLTD